MVKSFPLGSVQNLPRSHLYLPPPVFPVFLLLKRIFAATFKEWQVAMAHAALAACPHSAASQALEHL